MSDSAEVKHKYEYSRRVYFYTCGSCGKEFMEIDGDPDCFEEVGPQGEAECTHCGSYGETDLPE